MARRMEPASKTSQDMMKAVDRTTVLGSAIDRAALSEDARACVEDTNGVGAKSELLQVSVRNFLSGIESQGGCKFLPGWGPPGLGAPGFSPGLVGPLGSGAPG